MHKLILVVEDDPTIAEAISSRMRSEGFSVEVAEDGPSAVDLCERLAPDLLVLDLNLPGFDGIEVCRRVHVHRRLPVIMLTARDDETDMLIGLGIGADDYMTKPFSPRELVARTKAVLRRAEAPSPADSQVLEEMGLRINRSTRRVEQHGRQLQLTPTEFDLLYALVQAGGAVMSREQLLATVWGYRDGSGARTVDSHVRALRSKLTTDVIRTVHGVGYGLDSTIDSTIGVQP